MMVFTRLYLQKKNIILLEGLNRLSRNRHFLFKNVNMLFERVFEALEEAWV